MDRPVTINKPTIVHPQSSQHAPRAEGRCGKLRGIKGKLLCVLCDLCGQFLGCRKMRGILVLAKKIRLHLAAGKMQRQLWAKINSLPLSKGELEGVRQTARAITGPFQ